MKNKLSILWTNANPITAEFMVFLYAENSLVRNWWDEVEIIVWGEPTRLVVENKTIQEKLLDIQKKGVQVRFCITCAKKLGVVSELESLGFELELMGVPLTEILKKDGKLLTV